MFHASNAPTGLPVRLVSCRLIAAFLLAALLVCGASIARADDEDAKPAPRTAVIIGGASIVLVATPTQLYAFVDRIEDNAPVADAELAVDTSEGTSIDLRRVPLTMNKATEGMFVGPLNRVGQMQGAFMVSLKSSAGTGDAPAEIVYSDVQPPPVIAAGTGMGVKLGIAIVSAGIGAIVAMLVGLWWARRRTSVRPVGTASAT